MKLAPFTYAAPASIDDVIAWLDAHGEASKLLAGGRIGHPTTRNRGTVGGRIAHADPAAERAGTSHL